MTDQSMSNAKTIREGDGSSLGRIDRYELVRELGGGGFGCVYLAHDTVAKVDVAIKGLPPLVQKNREELENIRENFALVSRLHHPHIAAALVLHPAKAVSYADRATAEKLRVFEGDFLVVMEYAPGVTLSQWRKQFPNDRVPLAQVCEIIRQLADALDYAHEQKIIHRDVKPSNIMIETRSDGSLVARILDFGLAAEVRSSMGRVSQQVTDKSGTRPYMAPEQWLGKKQGDATDQYALAVLAYELLTGEVPFASVFETGDPVVMMQVVECKRPEIARDLPSAIRRAFARAFAKNQEARFVDCRALATALSACGATMGLRRLLAAVLIPLGLVALGYCVYSFNRPPPVSVVVPEEPAVVPVELDVVPEEPVVAPEVSVADPPVPAVTSVVQVVAQIVQVVTSEPERVPVVAVTNRPPVILPVQKEPAVVAKPFRVELPRTTVGLPAGAVGYIDLGDGLKMEMIWCPSGTFVRGSPLDEAGRGTAETLCEVQITSGFWLGKFEVTRAQWKRVMGREPIASDNRVDENCPIGNVTYFECESFVRELNARTGDTRFRLPSSTEWEYACRAGSRQPFAVPMEQVNCREAKLGRPLRVGSRTPNGWGFHDMQGNVEEWTMTDATDAATKRLGMVLRGGGWGSRRWDCRAASLRYEGPHRRGATDGVRVCYAESREPSVRIVRRVAAVVDERLLALEAFRVGNWSLGHQYALRTALDDPELLRWLGKCYDPLVLTTGFRIPKDFEKSRMYYNRADELENQKRR